MMTDQPPITQPLWNVNNQLMHIQNMGSGELDIEHIHVLSLTNMTQDTTIGPRKYDGAETGNNSETVTIIAPLQLVILPYTTVTATYDKHKIKNHECCTPRQTINVYNNDGEVQDVIHIDMTMRAAGHPHAKSQVTITVNNIEPPVSFTHTQGDVTKKCPLGSYDFLVQVTDVATEIRVMDLGEKWNLSMPAKT